LTFKSLTDHAFITKQTTVNVKKLNSKLSNILIKTITYTSAALMNKQHFTISA